MTKAFQIDPRPLSGAAKFIFSLRANTFALLIISSFALLGSAQSDENIVRVDTKLAQFEVLVEDHNGKPVHGLKPGDFRILEDGKERRIDFFQPVVSPGTARPLVIAFAVDVSGSMTPPEIEKLRNAISGFIKRFGDHESYFA